MSIRSLPADAVTEIEPNGVAGSTAHGASVSGATDGDDSRHVPPDKSPDDGPPIAELVGAEPVTDDGKSALQYGASRYERKRRVVAELLDRGRDGLARRVSSCGNNGFRCDRPHLCRLCHRHKRFDAKQRYAGWVRTWDGHVLVALTMPETRSHPAVARTDVLDRFRTVRRRAGFKSTVSRAFGGVHTVRDDDTGEFRAHLDLLVCTDATATVRSELSAVWSDVGGGHVEMTAVTAPSDGTHADAVEATTCYVVEKTDLSVGAQTDYATVRPDGQQHWVTVGGGGGT